MQPTNAIQFRRPGFLVIELLLALAISSMVATLVAMMLVGVGAATSDQEDLRSVIVQRHIASERVGSALRCAASVLSSDAAQIVLWKGDANGNDLPDLSELRRIHWNADTQSVTVSESPNTISAGQDETFQFSDDFNAIAASRAGAAAFPERTLLRHVSQWEASFDASPAQLASLVRITMEMQSAAGTEDAIVIAALRAKERASS